MYDTNDRFQHGVGLYGTGCDKNEDFSYDGGPHGYKHEVVG